VQDARAGARRKITNEHKRRTPRKPALAYQRTVTCGEIAHFFEIDVNRVFTRARGTNGRHMRDLREVARGSTAVGQSQNVNAMIVPG